MSQGGGGFGRFDIITPRILIPRAGKPACCDSKHIYVTKKENDK